MVDGSIGYIYDAEGRRVGNTDGTVYTVTASGDVLDEVKGTTWKRSEVYVGGKHLATVTASGVVFVHGDWLGTKRARTNMAGVMCESMTSLPFGDNGTPAGSYNVTPDFLTGKPRDAESGLDDFGARYLSSQWGRWMSADWTAGASAVPYATLTNPQSLNLYAYVGNDPIDGQDADGHFRTNPNAANPYLSFSALANFDGNGSDEALSGVAPEAFLANQQQQASVTTTQTTTAVVPASKPPNPPASDPATGQGSGTAAAQQQTTAQTQQQIADAARGQLGSTDYAKSAPPCGQWKCSKFVGAILNAVGIGVHQGYPSDPNLPPVAGDWANPKVAIKNWTMLPVGATPQAGDVAAYKENYADATGHAGIVYQVNQRGAYVIAAGEKHVYGTYSFGDGTGATVRYRRYTPDGGSQ